LGQFLSTIGSGLTAFGLGIYVFQQTQSVTSFTMILLCIFLPSFLIKPLGGVLADRIDRRAMMLTGDFGSSLGLIFIFFMMYYGNVELWYIYLGIVISSVFGAVQEPAYKASVTDLLPKKQYAKASGLMQLSHSSQYFISPFIAGILLSLFNIKLIFLIDIITFFIAIITIIWVRKIIGTKKLNKKKQTFTKDLKEGINEFFKHKGVVWLVGITMLILFFVGLLQSLLVPMLLSLTNTKITGIIQSVSASGMLIGSLLIGLFGSKKDHAKILAFSLFFAGLFFSFMGASTNIIYITIAGFLFFSFLPFVNTNIEVLIRNKIHNKKQGRVWSIISVITYLGSIIAFVVAGFLADKVFNPLLKLNGILAESIGTFIGVGDTRGIGLMFVISGIFISFIALIIYKNKSIKDLEKNQVQG